MNKAKKRYDYRLCQPNKATLDKAAEFLIPETRGKLLDVGAGTGLLSQKLASLGFTVFACDLEPKHFCAHNISIKKANLQAKLPYPDHFFDYVTCTEVLEHLENPWHACRELSRVLRKNGKLVLTLPNFSNLISRSLFFIRGNFRQFDEWFWNHWGHINPITFMELKQILDSAGLEVEEVQTAEKMDRPYALFLRLVQKISSAIFHLFKIIRMDKDRKDKTLSILETEPLLFGESLILKCRKR